MAILNPLMPPRLELGSVPNVIPFTMRENFSQMGLVEGMRHWIVTRLIPYINENFTDLDDKWVEQANKLIADFDAIVIALVADVNEAVAQITDQVDQAEAAQAAAEAARDLAQLYASQVEEIQDTAVTNIVSDETSALFTKLSELFVSATAFTTISNLVNGHTTELGAIDSVLDGRLSDATLQSKFVQSVVMIGAGIDRTGVVDSTTAMQAIIDANPRSQIFIPSGVYKFTALTVRAGQKLVGEGRSTYRDRYTTFGTAGWMSDDNFGGTILRSVAGTDVAITIVDPDEVTEGGMSDITLIGPGSGTATGVYVGSASPIMSVVNPQFTNVVIGNFATGMKMAYVNEGVFTSLIIRGCLLGLDFVTAVNHNVFTGLDIQWSGDGIVISQDSYSNTFPGLICQSLSGTGVDVYGTKNTFYNPYFEGVAEGAIRFRPVANANLVDSPTLMTVASSLIVDALAPDNQLLNVGWSGAAATIVDNGLRTRITGNIQSLAGSGIDRLIIDPGNAGSAFGAWKDYELEIIGVGWSLGNAVVETRYCRAGRRVTGRIYITWGSTSTFGSGLLKVTLPWVAASRGQVSAHAVKNGVGVFDLFPRVDLSTENVTVFARSNSTNEAVAFTNSYPATWAPNDTLEVFFDYEAIA